VLGLQVWNIVADLDILGRPLELAIADAPASGRQLLKVTRPLVAAVQQA